MFHPDAIEEACYDKAHIESIATEIRANFPLYFEKFIKSDSGVLADDKLKELSAKFGGTFSAKKAFDRKGSLGRLVEAEIAKFEKDRDKYKIILDPEYLEQAGDDPPSFKNTTLKNKCPIILQTLQNTPAKELDKYRRAFKAADPADLYATTKNIMRFTRDHYANKFDAKTHEMIDTLDGLGLSELSDEKYIAFGVIGGGIRSQFMYKLYPDAYPYRGRESVWAFWYLTKKKTFGCKQDSEFLMINRKESTTQQNYYYPYDLFAFYALQVFKLMNDEAAKNSYALPLDYRYVPVEAFLSFVARSHQPEIDALKSQIKDEEYQNGY